MFNISPVKVWRNQSKIRRLLNRKGKVISWTKVFAPPSGFSEEAPYIVAIVEFGDGSRHTAQLVDYEEKDLNRGLQVLTVLRRTRNPGEEGVIPYGVKFKPLNND